jgi:hypothetical protein
MTYHLSNEQNMSEEAKDAIISAIDAAEDVHDPIEKLVERSSTDPSAPFESDVVAQLAAMKKDDPATFEAVRARLKGTGCRLTALDEAIDEVNGGRGGRGLTQADILIELAQSAELFHIPDGTAFADIRINDHRESWTIRGKGFRRWLARRYYEETRGAPSSEAMQSALNVIDARAHFDSPERAVHIRVGGQGDRLYLDLCDETWRAVEIDASGWRVINDPPVRFRRAAGMLALPMPVSGGSVETLRAFLNLRTDADFVLAVGWILACLRDRGPYPVLVLSGEQGSAKSTFSTILRALLDPNTAPLRALPREDRDLFIAASNGHVLAFDNVSGLQTWISDTLSRLATGGGFAVRQLYTDQDEVLFDATRPVILNGIEDIVTRPDLADRAVFLMLEPIPDESRRPEGRLRHRAPAHSRRAAGCSGRGFEAVVRDPFAQAATEGRLCAVGDRLRDGSVAFQAPFGRLIAATAMRPWTGSSTLTRSPVRAFMVARTEWTGTAAVLLGDLEEMAGQRIAKSKTWPNGPRALAGRLRQAATFLRKVGIECRFDREGKARTRMIHITATPSLAAPEQAGVQPSVPSAPSAPMMKSNPTKGFTAPSPRTVANDADGGRGNRDATVRVNPLKSRDADDADGADASHPSQSVQEKTRAAGRWSARL